MMNFSYLQGSYDYIISLGFNCKVAYNLERAGLRAVSLPFDWLVCDPRNVANFIQNGFEGFLDLRYLEDTGEVVPDRIGERKRVIDRTHWVEFLHDFNVGESLENALPRVQEKYKRRIARFYEIVRKKKCLFIITDCQEKLLPLFVKALGKRAKFVVLQQKDGTSFHRVKKLHHFEVYEYDDRVKNASLAWKGNPLLWQEICKGLHCRSQIKEDRKRIAALNDITLSSTVSCFQNRMIDSTLLRFFARKLNKTPSFQSFIHYGILQGDTSWVNAPTLALFVRKKNKKAHVLCFDYYCPFAKKIKTTVAYGKEQFVIEQESGKAYINLGDRRLGDVLHVELKVSPIFSPKELGLNEDERPLSFIIYNIDLVESK